MTLQPPPGQDPIDPRGAFSPPPAPSAGGPGQFVPPPGWNPPYQVQMGGQPPRNMPPMGPTMMPPMMPMMPPMMMPYPPGKPPKSFARAIFMTLATTIFGISILANFYLLMLSGLTGGRGSQHSAIVEGNLNETIAVIPVSGMILQNTADRFNKFMNQAEKDPNVKAIVIEVETPGGAVTPSDEIYHRIDSFKAAHPKTPVVVSMGNLATSGGYYVSSRADWIIAQPTTMTGNIGVIMPRYNVAELAAKWGIQETTVTAPPVGFKNAGSMFNPVKKEETEYLQALIDGAYQRFLTVVTNGRGTRLKKPIEEIADGKVYLADKALADGLVDQIGFPDDAYKYAATMAGLSNPTVVKYREPPTFLDLLGAESKSNLATGGAFSAGGVTINGVNVNLDASLLDSLRTPRVLYMWQGQ